MNVITIDEPVTFAAGVGNEEYRVVNTEDTAFPHEYSVSGWWRWTGPYVGAWHNVFRLTANDKS